MSSESAPRTASLFETGLGGLTGTDHFASLIHQCENHRKVLIVNTAEVILNFNSSMMVAIVYQELRLARYQARISVVVRPSN